MRLNKFISHNSSYSRREADKLIKEGFVRIGKKLVANPVNFVSYEDSVFVKNKLIKMKTKYSVIIYNKPRGELVSKNDDRGRKTIYHSLGNKFKGFIYIGRLDFLSEGLLLLTDSPKVSDLLSKSNIKRVYKVKIKGYINDDIINAMKNGINLANALAGAHSKTNIRTMSFKPFLFEIKKNTKTYSILKVSIDEGKNRELRRFFAYFDREVTDIKRISIGKINLNSLPTGKKRFLSKQEYKYLKDFIKEESKVKE